MSVKLRATYRVQLLQPGFAFDEAVRLADYLARLGISHLYSSPYLGSPQNSDCKVRFMA